MPTDGPAVPGKNEGGQVRRKRRRRKVKEKEDFQYKNLVTVFGTILIISGLSASVGVVLVYGGFLDIGDNHDSVLSILKFILRIEEIDGELMTYSNQTDQPSSRMFNKNLTGKITSAVKRSLVNEGFSLAVVRIVSFSPTEPVKVEKSMDFDEQLGRVFNGVNKQRREMLDNEVRLVQAEIEATGMVSENAALVMSINETNQDALTDILELRLGGEGIISEIKDFEIQTEFIKKVKSAISANATKSPPALASFLVHEADCNKRFAEIEDPEYVAECPSGCAEASGIVLGGIDSLYTRQSPVCMSAIHSGLMEKEGGEVGVLYVGYTKRIKTQGKQNGIKAHDSIWRRKSVKVKEPTPVIIPTPVVLPPPTTAPPPAQQTSSPPMTESSKPKPLTTRSIGIFRAVTQISKVDGVVHTYPTTVLSHYKYNQISSKFSLASSGIGLTVDLVDVHGFLTDASDINIFANWTMIGPEDKNYEFINKLGCPNIKLVEKTLHGMILGDLVMARNFEGKNISLVLLAEVRKHCLFGNNANSGTDEEIGSNVEGANPDNTGLFGKTCPTDILFIHKTSLISQPEKDSVKNFYAKLFSSIDFDKTKLRFAMYIYYSHLAGDDQFSISANLGSETSESIISNVLNKHFGDGNIEADVVSRVTKLSSVLGYIQKNTPFFDTSSEKKSKLIYIITDEIEFENEKSYLNNLFEEIKDQMIDIAFLGYNWNKDTNPGAFGGKNVIYDLATTSREPYVIYTEHLADIETVADDVITLLKSQVSCIDDENLSAVTESTITITYSYGGALSPPMTNSFPNLVDGHSYSKPPPKGNGMRPYATSTGWDDGSKFEPFRLTEPDSNQALYLDGNCGFPVSDPKLGRIAGGVESKPNAWPWVASVAKQDLFGKLENFCGGVLVSAAWVLTSAYCFRKQGSEISTGKATVLIGFYDFDGAEKNDKSLRYSIKNNFVHPEYSTQTSDGSFTIVNDLMLLELSRPVPLEKSSKTGLICLPNPDVVPKNFKNCYMSGWGKYDDTSENPRKLKQGRFSISDPDWCYAKWSYTTYDVNKQVCDDREIGIASDVACEGDTGAALVCEENSRWVVYGIYSYGGRKCNTMSLGNVFTLIPSYLTWVCCFIQPKIGPCPYTKCKI